MSPYLEPLVPPFVMKFLARLKAKRRQYYGLGDLDKKIEQRVDYDNEFVVELGANDGITQSNTLYFERQRQWRGALIEPTPHNYL
jgi:hypothetical protein